MSETTVATVRIRVEDDGDANRVAAVLEALGYTVLRDLEGSEDKVEWSIQRIAGESKLTARETDILRLVVQGKNPEQIARTLEISRATVKWHMHNLHAKTNTGNREALLRLALQM